MSAHDSLIHTIYIYALTVHTEKSFLSLVKSNIIWTVVTVFRLIWRKSEFRLVPKSSEKCNYSANLVRIYQIQKRFIRINMEFLQGSNVEPSERLAPLGIMWSYKRPSWNPFNDHSKFVTESFNGILNWVPIMPLR